MLNTGNDHEIESHFFQEIERRIMRSKVSITFDYFAQEVDRTIMRLKVAKSIISNF